MAKKSKEKKNSKSNSNQTSAFSSLFGDAPEDADAASIFSNSNPFRRKPEDNSQKSIEKTPKIDLINVADSADKKDKKKGKDKLKRLGEGSDGDVVEKSKKLKKNSDLELELEAGVENGGVEEKKKKKKKRKRDEVEVEYEKKVYGEAAVEEEAGNVGAVVGEKRKKMENPEELMVSKEGFDDEEKLLRTVFVGNLSLKIKKKVLMKEFGVFGEVESVRIRSIPILDSKTPRKGAIMKKQINESADSVHAYIVFKTVESAQAALAHNMAMIGENHIRVDRACPPRKKLKGDSTPLYDNQKTVFLGNLPFDVKDEELYQLFTRMKGLEFSLEAVRVIRDPATSLGKGIAYVLFKTKEAAKMVIRKRELRLRDRDLRVTHVKVNSTPKKIQSVSPGQGAISSKRGSVESGTPRQNPSASMSYQGIRASKSGVSKKTSTNTGRRVDLNPSNSNQKAKEPVGRKRKRPTVAARKAKALKSDFAMKTSGMKRKPVGNRTPDSSYQKKKARIN